MSKLMMKRWIFLVFAFASMSPMAQDFDELTPDIQNVLQRFEGQWSDMDPERQARLVTGAERWLTMDVDQRQAARSRFQQWQNLSPAVRAELTNKIQTFRDLPDDQKLKIKRAFENYQSLNAQQRARLRALYQQMNDAQRARLRQMIRDRQ